MEVCVESEFPIILTFSTPTYVGIISVKRNRNFMDESVKIVLRVDHVDGDSFF